MSGPVKRSDSIVILELEDTATPFGSFLSGKYQRCFAYKTIKDRLPIILTKIIDGFSRNKELIAEKFGSESLAEIKDIIGCVSKLKNEMVTNKPITPLPVIADDSSNDAVKWNDRLKELETERGEIQTWYNTIWLFCECYMYRRIGQALELSKCLKSYDPFEDQKQENFFQSVQSIHHLSKHMVKLLSLDEMNDKELKSHFLTLLKLSLWGNRCDLSLSSGTITSQTENQLDLIRTLDNLILSNDSEKVWDILSKKCFACNNVIDIVLDNAGYELFTDLCLATLLSHFKSTKFRFYVKKYPWFVSDVMEKDFLWTVNTMKASENEDLKKFGNICEMYLSNSRWSIESESFWTEPYDFSQMKKVNPDLYEKLSNAGLIIFKGDLNYRKLLGDFNCEYSTDFKKALRGFGPSNLVALRTIKADLCAGLPDGTQEILDKEEPEWTNTGKYGLIQVSIKE